MSIKKFPDTITIVVSILLVFVGLTWLIPAGEYQRDYTYKLDESFYQKTLEHDDLDEVRPYFSSFYPSTFIGEKEFKETLAPVMEEGQWEKHAEKIKELSRYRKVVIPGTYEKVKSNPQNLWDFLVAPIKGFENAVLVIGFVFLVGGAFGILNKTGAIEAGLARMITFSKDRPQYKVAIIPIVMVLFSIAGATFGMSEEVLVFIMITIPLAMALGYDSIVGVAMPFIGAGAGFAGAFSNPFTVGIAQGISNVPMFSGWEYRLVVWLVFTVAAIAYVMWYARRVMLSPERSSMYEIDNERELQENAHATEFNIRHKLVLLSLTGALVLLIVGVTMWDWYIQEIAGLFIGLGILSAFIYRLSTEESTSAFLSGAKDMMTAAMVIALTNGILTVATDGKIIDTILHTLATSANGLPKAISIQIMFMFQGFLNFFMPSGSGQAALTMPIMAPLSDLLGITRQTSVLAFQLGDGLFNMIIPTSGVTMGVLAIGKIPFNKWFRWLLPLMIGFLVLGMLLLVPPAVGWVNF